jgi:hypothetical protein
MLVKDEGVGRTAIQGPREGVVERVSTARSTARREWIVSGLLVVFEASLRALVMYLGIEYAVTRAESGTARRVSPAW